MKIELMLRIVFLAAIATASNAGDYQLLENALVNNTSANNTGTNITNSTNSTNGTNSTNTTTHTNKTSTNSTDAGGLICNPQTEVECTRCGYGQDGSPIPVQYCADIVDGCSVEVCCDIMTEETCYDDTTGDAYSCARYDEGGCPCQGANETKCGVSEFSSGYCTTLCCDWTTEQTCYDDNWEPVSCRKYEDGACPSYQSSFNNNNGLAATSRMEKVNYSDEEKKEELNYLFD